MLDALLVFIFANKLYFMSFVGSLVSALFQKTYTPLPLITSLVGGFVATYICSPIILSYFTSLEPGAIGLIMGMIGSNIVTSILKIGDHFQKNSVSIASKILKHKLHIEAERSGEYEAYKPEKKPSGKINLGDIKDIETRR